MRDATRLRSVFSTYRPEVVFHAAAHKHVPLMEDAPTEAILNNVIGTGNVVDLCLEFGVGRLVNISTDKAVNPTSVMGGSKRVAEMVVSAGAARTRETQAFVSVRFGNVLGSRGSVVPTFMAQIRAGGPITVTHPEMTRYFMTIPEAARLVLQAGGLAENGKVYLLNMGSPIKISDLAHDVIRLSGAQNVEVVYTGIRPGEKLYEELLTSGEGTTGHHPHRDLQCPARTRRSGRDSRAGAAAPGLCSSERCGRRACRAGPDSFPRTSSAACAETCSGQGAAFPEV